MVNRTMRVFKYNEYEDTEPRLITEQEIRVEYWPHWYGKMCEKYGKEIVDANYSFEMQAFFQKKLSDRMGKN